MPYSNPALIKNLIAIIATFLFVFLLKRYKEALSSNPITNRLQRHFTNFNFKIGNPFLTILIPTLIIVFESFIFTNFVKPEAGSLVLLFIVTVLLQPIAEEILFRGWLLGIMKLIIDDFKEKLGVFHPLFMGLALAIQALVFMFVHERGFNIPLIVDGMIFGLMYLIYRKNLIPATTAHIVNNFLIFLVNHKILHI